MLVPPLVQGMPQAQAQVWMFLAIVVLLVLLVLRALKPTERSARDCSRGLAPGLALQLVAHCLLDVPLMLT